MTPPIALRVRGLSAAINDEVIVHAVDLDAAPGEMVGIVGPNGSGKSTLLRAVAGLRSSSSGTVHAGELSLARASPRARAKVISFVGQEEEPTADLLVGEYVAIGRSPHATPWGGSRRGDRAAVDAALRKVGLHGYRDRTTDALSGGERRRVVLARGLAQEAGIIILDEPTNHLDIRHQLELLATVRESGQTVLMAIHDLSLAVQTCDRLLVLQRGVRMAFDRPHAVVHSGVLGDVFGVDTHELRNPATGRTHVVVEARGVPVS